jgi:hypothetical protein
MFPNIEVKTVAFATYQLGLFGRIKEASLASEPPENCRKHDSTGG